MPVIHLEAQARSRSVQPGLPDQVDTYTSWNLGKPSSNLGHHHTCISSCLARWYHACYRVYLFGATIQSQPRGIGIHVGWT